MTPPEVLPFGSWPTPITSELVVRAARLPGAVQVDGEDLWWSEGRPDEGGRTAILRRRPDGRVDEVLAAPWNARTRVHEYGGGAWWVSGGVLWFADWATQRLHRVDPGSEPVPLTPVPLTPEPEVPRGWRFADGSVHPDGRSVLCVREEHHDDGSEATNTIVRLAASEPSTPEVVVEGPDFVADPRWNPDGSAFCWLEWDHPDMPWDATRLVVDAGGHRTVVAGGDVRESVCQPTWAPDGSLWFSADRTGFWSLYRWSPGGAVESMVDLGRDIGFPQWVFGQSCFALLHDGRTAFVYKDGGSDHLAVRTGAGDVFDVGVPYTSIDGMRARGSRVVAVVASASTEPHVAELDLDGGDVTVLVEPRDLGLDVRWFAEPQAIEFPTGAAPRTGGAARAHALLYRPANPDVAGPPGAAPPLLVLIHGGPTAAARPMLQLSRAYWTSRGFAVVDVNYRGSTGYGRAYRDLLRGQWGVADVEDCVAVVAHLAAQGVIDAARCCIRGGSAGGFTTLAALAFHDAFAAGASHYGVADLGVLAEETHKFESRYLDGLVGAWPQARATYEARSPIFHTDGIDRPLAVFQGLDDPIVPPNQAEMIVEALRARNVPVAYMAFEGEQHGFRQGANIRAALDGELSFYAQVLGFELPPDEGIEPVEIS
ncbi:MAG: prolyl oligopeptidase family serine peptidase [Acidimicrobiales bacterium]|nr:prolyl oligopeptidase family serine peptidase [Acidimicrobiales bacterium]